MFSIKSSILFTAITFSLLGCGGSGGESQDDFDKVQGLAFPIPLSTSRFWSNTDYYINQGELVYNKYYGANKIVLSEDTRTRTSYHYDNNEELVRFVLNEETSDPYYYLSSDALWVETTGSKLISFNADNTVLTSGNNKVKLKAIDNITGNQKVIIDSDIEVPMPDNAKKYSIIIKTTNEKYYAYHPYIGHTNGVESDFSSLSALMEVKCNSNLLAYKNSETMRGYAFKCGQEDATEGSLVGIKHDYSLMNEYVGSWKIIDLPNSAEAIEIILDKKYDQWDYRRHNILVMKDGKVWSGRRYFAGKVTEDVEYSSNVFMAVDTKLGQLVGGGEF